jgi:hypothetical protein
MRAGRGKGVASYSGEVRSVATEWKERDVVGVQDFVLLENYESEEAFIKNLQDRFRSDLIYVSTVARHAGVVWCGVLCCVVWCDVWCDVWCGVVWCVVMCGVV